jgi:hypothetical protein
MSPTLPPIPGHDPNTFAWKLSLSPLAASLTESEQAAVLSLLTAPLAYSYREPCKKADRPEFVAILRKLKTPRLPALAWLHGLIHGGHSDRTLKRLERAGVLYRWDLYSGTCVTLSCWAAELLGVEVRELLPDDPTALRWGLARPSVKIKVRRQFWSAREQILMGLIDGAPSPEANAMDAERWTHGKPEVLDVWSDEPLKLLGGFKVYIDPKLLKAIQVPRGRPNGQRKKRAAAVASVGQN